MLDLLFGNEVVFLELGDLKIMEGLGGIYND